MDLEMKQAFDALSTQIAAQADAQRTFLIALGKTIAETAAKGARMEPDKVEALVDEAFKAHSLGEALRQYPELGPALASLLRPPGRTGDTG